MCRKAICLVSLVLAMGQISYGGLVAQWKFNNDLTDSVGTLTWTANGGAGFSTDAKQGSHSLSTDGVDDYLSVTPTGPLLVQFSTHSVALWFKANSTAGTQVLFDEGGTTRGMAIRINNGNLEAAVRESSTPVTVSTSFSSTTWTHVAATFDNGVLKLYMQGAERASAMATFTLATQHSNTAGIGARAGQDSFGGTATGDYFGGLIDDVRIYDNALSLVEIGQLAGELWPYAYNPSPADGAIVQQTWTSLVWSAGLRTVSHNVYLGDNFDDVNAGTGDTFRGNQASATFMAGFPGFAYPGGLTPGVTYYWRIDEVNNAAPESPWKGDVWSFTVPSKKAYNPAPADGSKYVVPSTTLSWTAGLNAKVRYVYFGDKFDDVNNATGATTQSATTYTPAGPLEQGKTYYWRVDEFDGAATHKGDVWSFRTMPVMAITDPNLVAWWKLDEGFGTTAADYSGHGHHGTTQGDTLRVDGYDGGALQFDGTGDYVNIDGYKGIVGAHARTVTAWVKTTSTATGEIVGWGPNVASQKMELRIDVGRLRCEHQGGNVQGSTNLTDGGWHHVAVTISGNATVSYPEVKLYLDGVDDTIPTTDPDAFATVAGNDVRIGSRPSNNDRFFAGLIDDVRIYDKELTPQELELVMRIDLLPAWKPAPKDGARLDIEHVTPLVWARGDKATQHEVYFSLDKAAVADANASDTTGIYRGRQSATSYTPPEGLAWGGGPYFWRVDEDNNDGTVTKGRIWSFTVGDYLIVDDIESYNDSDPPDPRSHRIFDAWSDGFATPTTNGALVGNNLPPYTERANVHGGGQAMPLSYDNNLKFSEATLTRLSSDGKAGNDWTRQGVANLSLWHRGLAANAAEKMYVALNGTAVVYHTDPNVAKTTAWTEWVIPLQQFAALGVNLTNVTSITIGFGTRGSTALPGGTGQMYLDDIRLYRPKIVP